MQSVVVTAKRLAKASETHAHRSTLTPAPELMLAEPLGFSYQAGKDFASREPVDCCFPKSCTVSGTFLPT
jgi:hypothetical protein